MVLSEEASPPKAGKFGWERRERERALTGGCWDGFPAVGRAVVWGQWTCVLKIPNTASMGQHGTRCFPNIVTFSSIYKADIVIIPFYI